nr:MAG TPA: hypothetical protein [Caudoviricetes sp.]
MNKIELIRKEVEQYISDNVSARKSKVDVAANMPSFEGFIAYLVKRELHGEEFPVDLIHMYVYSERYEQMYARIIIETVTK